MRPSFTSFTSSPSITDGRAPATCSSFGSPLVVFAHEMVAGFARPSRRGLDPGQGAHPAKGCTGSPNARGHVGIDGRLVAVGRAHRSEPVFAHTEVQHAVARRAMVDLPALLTFLAEQHVVHRVALLGPHVCQEEVPTVGNVRRAPVATDLAI